MTSRTVNYIPTDDAWTFNGETRLWDGACSIVIKRGDLAAGATDLATALRVARRAETEPEAILIDLAPDDEYSPKEAVVDFISFDLDPQGALS